MNGITAVPGVRVGHATDTEARTGCTVVLGPFRAACDVRGLATGTRELETVSPFHLVSHTDAILLTGGSAFGLAASDGVSAWLHERGAGYDAGVARVPIVPAAVIFDLGVGRADRWPDHAMGRAACEAAAGDSVDEGSVGAGTGATVGKLRGMPNASRGGVGSAALETLGHTIGAIAVVNAFGDVRDDSGGILAGARGDDGEFVDTSRALVEGESLGDFDPLAEGERPQPGTNTTLVLVATDAPVTQTALQSVARAGATAVARRISPVHTPFDGDVTFAVSTATDVRRVSPAAIVALGAAAAHVVERAIERAVTVGG